MLYHLALAMHPRILSLFDENLKPLSLTVRVGQAVDVVGQAGNRFFQFNLFETDEFAS